MILRRYIRNLTSAHVSENLQVDHNMRTIAAVVRFAIVVTQLYYTMIVCNYNIYYKRRRRFVFINYYRAENI